MHLLDPVAWLGRTTMTATCSVSDPGGHCSQPDRISASMAVTRLRLAVRASGSPERSLWPGTPRCQPQQRRSVSPPDAAWFRSQQIRGATFRQAGPPGLRAVPPEAPETVATPALPLRGVAPARSPQSRWRIPTVGCPIVANRRPVRLPVVPEGRRSTRLSRAADDSLPGASHVGLSLGLHPRCRIDAPAVSGIGDRLERRLNIVPTSLVLEHLSNGCFDVGASLAGTGPSVEFCHDVVMQRYV